MAAAAATRKPPLLRPPTSGLEKPRTVRGDNNNRTRSACLHAIIQLPSDVGGRGIGVAPQPHEMNYKFC